MHQLFRQHQLQRERGRFIRFGGGADHREGAQREDEPRCHLQAAVCQFAVLKTSDSLRSLLCIEWIAARPLRVAYSAVSMVRNSRNCSIGLRCSPGARTCQEKKPTALSEPGTLAFQFHWELNLMRHSCSMGSALGLWIP